MASIAIHCVLPMAVYTYIANYMYMKQKLCMDYNYILCLYTGVRDDVTRNGVNIEKKLGDTSLEGMLKAGNLAVHLLPYSSIKGRHVGKPSFVI